MQLDVKVDARCSVNNSANRAARTCSFLPCLQRPSLTQHVVSWPSILQKNRSSIPLEITLWRIFIRVIRHQHSKRFCLLQNICDVQVSVFQAHRPDSMHTERVAKCWNPSVHGYARCISLFNV